MGNKKKKLIRQQAKENVSQKRNTTKNNETKLDKKRLLQILIFTVVIIASCVALYSVTTSYDLVFCDDNIFVHNFYNFNKDIANIQTSFEKTVGTTYYRPLLNVSFILDTVRGGTDPSVFRMTNLLLHIMGSCLVFFFLLKIGYDNIVSFIFAMFVAVHPVLTPSAAWISGRNDSMITVFILMAFIFFYFCLETRNKLLHYVYLLLHLLFFACSIFTKEIAFVVPLVGISYVYFYKKDKKLFTFQNIVIAIGWFVVGIIWYTMRLKAIEGITNPDTVGWSAIVANYPTLPALIGKIFLPVKLIALPTFEWFSIGTGTVFILAIAAYFYFSKKLDKKKALFGVLWFSLFLLPTFIVRIVYVDDFFDYAEHRAYLPMIGLLIVLIEFLKTWKVDFKKPVAIAIASVIILSLGVRSFYYQQHFKNRTTFWQHMVDMYPYKSRGYLDLGKAYFSNDDLKTAEMLYHKGIERNPNNKNLYIDLSVIYLRWNQLEKSAEYSKKAIDIDPEEPIANYNFGKANYMMNRVDLAIPAYEKACRNQGAFPQWFIDLGVAYYVTKQYEKSINAYDAAIRMQPDFALAYSNMGASYAVLGKAKDAETCWLKAIALNPKMYDSYQNLIRYYMTINNINDAKMTYMKLKQNGGEPFQDIKDNFKRMGINL